MLLPHPLMYLAAPAALPAQCAKSCIYHLLLAYRVNAEALVQLP